MRHLIIIAVALTLIGLVASAAALAQRTLPDRVKEYGDLRLSSAPTFPQMDLDNVVAKSDLIVRAKVISAQIHLSSDQRYIFTDFGLQPIAVLVQRGPERTMPGSTPRLIVSVLGGEMVIEGHNVTWTDTSLERFEIGKEYVLFLQRSPALDAYVLTGHSNGAFEVRNEGIEPRHGRSEHRGEPVGLFIKRVQAMIAHGR